MKKTIAFSFFAGLCTLMATDYALAGKAKCDLDPQKYSKEGKALEKENYSGHIREQQGLARENVFNNVERLRGLITRFSKEAEEICTKKQQETDLMTMHNANDQKAVDADSSGGKNACSPFRMAAKSYRNANNAYKNVAVTSEKSVNELSELIQSTGAASVAELRRLQDSSPLAKHDPEQAKKIAEQLRPEVKNAYGKESRFREWLKDFKKEAEEDLKKFEESKKDMAESAVRNDKCSSQ